MVAAVFVRECLGFVSFKPYRKYTIWKTIWCWLWHIEFTSNNHDWNIFSSILKGIKFYPHWLPNSSYQYITLCKAKACRLLKRSAIRPVKDVSSEVIHTLDHLICLYHELQLIEVDKAARGLISEESRSCVMFCAALLCSSNHEVTVSFIGLHAFVVSGSSPSGGSVFSSVFSGLNTPF